MNELIEKVENLKEVLDNTKEVKEINEINNLIMQDNDLLELIKKYQETQDPELKEKIINNDLFMKYKHSETELNLLIMGINSKLKKISDKGKCGI